MKIGAGGLQAIVSQDAARGLEAGKVKTPAEAALVQSEDPAVRKLIHDLNKAVERMRKAAQSFNLPMDFEIKRGEKPKIKARDRRTDVSREYSLEEAEEWLEETNRGKNKLNGYV